MTIETSYLNLLSKILYHGQSRMDRTGVGTRSLFGEQLTADLDDGFPLLTTKQIPFKSVIGELLWFVEGSNDERRLAEITYGTRDRSKKTIWTANTDADYWKPKAKFDGDVGRIYGVQWRRWHKKAVKPHVFDTSVDQLIDVINTIKTDPSSRRLIVTAWNVGELDQMVLPPCHCFFQFHVDEQDHKLDCLAYMRSVDTVLGLPFNIASYAALTHMVAQVTGHKPGKLVMSLGDTHIYNNHVKGVETQLSRLPYDLPKLQLNPAVDNIDDFNLSDFVLIGYKHHDKIKLPMAV